MIVFAILASLLFLLFLYLFVKERRRRKSLQKHYAWLTDSIDQFIENPEYSNYSKEDSDGAILQNKIAYLEEQILFSKSKLHEEQVRNHDFIADISHQLKTPLAALRLYSELSSDEYSQKEQVLIDRMESLIYQLLRMEKLRSGSYQLRFQELLVEQIVEEVWHELKNLYPQHQCWIEGSARVRMDPFWMKEAFHNILKNSCEKNSLNKEIIVQIGHSKNMVRILFEDFAGGVHTMDIRSLFERFNRSASETAGKNSGLGLAICKTIVQSHHGTIFAENTKEGLRVSIYLPIREGYRSY